MIPLQPPYAAFCMTALAVLIRTCSSCRCIMWPIRWAKFRSFLGHSSCLSEGSWMGQFCLSSRVAARPSAASPLSLFSLFNPGGLHSSSGSPASCALYIYKRLYPSLKLFVDFALQFSRTYVPQEVYQPLESPRFWFVGGHAASPCPGVRVRVLPRLRTSAYCVLRTSAYCARRTAYYVLLALRALLPFRYGMVWFQLLPK